MQKRLICFMLVIVPLMARSQDALPVKIPGNLALLQPAREGLSAPGLALPMDSLQHQPQLTGQPPAQPPLPPSEIIPEFVRTRASAPVSDSTMYALGLQNAGIYFQRRAITQLAGISTGLGWFTSGLSLALPLTLAFIPPKVRVKDIPDPALRQHPDYMAGYYAGARKKKRLLLLQGSGVGTACAGGAAGLTYLVLHGFIR